MKELVSIRKIIKSKLKALLFVYVIVIDMLLLLLFLPDLANLFWSWGKGEPIAPYASDYSVI